MNNVLAILGSIFLAPLIGALINGLDRKITARVQSRIGPPILQPIYDVLKLFRKQPIALNKMQILFAYLHLAFIMLVVIMLATGQDMLLVLFAYAFSTISLILGGLCVRSPFSRIGSQRKIMQMLAYEPVLVLMVVGIYFVNKSFQSGEVVTQAASSGPLLIKLPLIFLAFLMAVAIKLQKSPFDVSSSHHAHQELVKGITLEYAGPYLAVIELAHFYEYFVLFAIIASFWATNIFVGMGLAAAAFAALIALDNLFARLTARWMVKCMWTVGLLLAMANVIWFYL